MKKENFTEAEITGFSEAVKTWKNYKQDVMYWMEHHGHESTNKWIERHGSEGCTSPGYVTYMMDEFAKWIICNVIF